MQCKQAAMANAPVTHTHKQKCAHTHLNCVVIDCSSLFCWDRCYFFQDVVLDHLACGLSLSPLPLSLFFFLFLFLNSYPASATTRTNAHSHTRNTHKHTHTWSHHIITNPSHSSFSHPCLLLSGSVLSLSRSFFQQPGPIFCTSVIPAILQWTGLTLSPFHSTMLGISLISQSPLVDSLSH